MALTLRLRAFARDIKSVMPSVFSLFVRSVVKKTIWSLKTSVSVRKAQYLTHKYLS